MYYTDGQNLRDFATDVSTKVQDHGNRECHDIARPF
jgi:hypothetical protein